jgi:tRNA(Ile)-lysidine synthase
LDFAEDSSNVSGKYTRNFFRNEVIPLISQAYPQVKSNLRDNVDRFKEVSELYRVLIDGVKKKLCKHEGAEVHIPIKPFMSYRNRALIFELIRDYGFTEKQVEEVIKLAESESGKFIQSPHATYRLIKFRNWFIISPDTSNVGETIVIDEKKKSVEIRDLKIKIENRPRTSNFRPPASNSIACLDSAKITFPLILRKYRPGDYFYPLGMPKKKKIARFFIDQKLARTEKEKMWVIEMNKKIIWVVGLRIDDRFKITDQTKNILRISSETG